MTDLEVLVGQVDLQAERVHPLWQRPGLKLSQRVDVLTESGQHILHQDDLITHLCLLQTQQTLFVWSMENKKCHINTIITTFLDF